VAAAALAGGALVKESALVLAPLLVVALELGRPRRRLRARLFASQAAAVGAAMALRGAFAPAWRAAARPLRAGGAVGARLAAAAKSTAAVLVPVDRSLCDAFAVTHWWQATSLAGLAVLVAIAIAAWKKRGPALLLAVSILPALQLVPVMRWWSPHYLYVPCA